jgi:hypothetical protein
MPKFSIAFVVPGVEKLLRHSIVENSDQDSALREFFNAEALDLYSSDDQGFHYFKEDFFDEKAPSGSIIKLSS